VRRFRVLILGLAAAGLAACDVSPSSGTVKGGFERVGGPAQVGRVPLSGTVKFVGPAGTYTVSVGRSGRFTSSVPSGTYEVSGRSPQLNGRTPCATGLMIQVHSGATSRVAVICEIR